MTNTDKPIHMTGKEYYNLLQKTRREALEEAAKENCLYCRHGDKPKFKMRWHHTDSNGVVFGVCQSDKIYRLMAADQGQGQTTQAGPVEGNEGELGTLEHLIWLDEKIAKAVENIGTEED